MVNFICKLIKQLHHDHDRLAGERVSVQMIQKIMGENCYMNGQNMKIGNICPK